MSNYVKTTAASAVGAFIEWYDFFIYGTAAALIFPKLFFTNLSPVAASVVSIASYSIAFVFRPLGGLIAGHYGDKYGRKKVLTATLLLMGVCTVGIGLLPTYEQVGLLAPALLLLLRILQGFAIGGEWGASAVMVYEHSPYNLKALFGSSIQVGVPLSILAANSLYTIIGKYLDESAFLAWGWRLPFIASIVIVAVGSYIRKNLKEPQEFEEIKNKEGRAPIKEVFAKHKSLVLKVAGMRAIQNLMFVFYTVYLLGYITNILKLPKQMALNGVVMGAALGLVTIPLVGFASDLFGRKFMFNIGILATIAFIYPALNMLPNGADAISFVFIVGFMIHDFMYGQQAALIPESFPAPIRVTASNVSYGLGAAAAGLIMPVVPLVQESYGVTGISALIIITGLVSLWCVQDKRIGKRFV